MKTRRRPRRLNYAVDIPFAVDIHRLAARDRVALLAWLRRLRLGRPGGYSQPPRAFYELDPTTGRWQRL